MRVPCSQNSPFSSQLIRFPTYHSIACLNHPTTQSTLKFDINNSGLYYSVYYVVKAILPMVKLGTSNKPTT